MKSKVVFGLVFQTITFPLDLQKYWETQGKIMFQFYHVKVNIYTVNIKSRSGAET